MTDIVIRGFCALMLFVFAADKAFAQIGAVIDALPADRDYVEGITASIPGYRTMTEIEKVRALRRYVYQHTPLSWTNKFLIHDEVVNLPLREAYSLFDKTAGGVWCGGTAIMLSRVFRAAGFNSWLYNFGVIDGPSHVTTLVEADENIVLQDGYFNIEYVDGQGMPVPFRELISRIRNGAPPAPKDEVANRVVLFKDFTVAERVVGPNRDIMTCQTNVAGLRCSAPIALSHYLNLEEERDLYEFLQSRGWPRQFEFLMLYPINLVSMYSDTVAQAESLLDDINRKVRDLPLDIRHKLQ
jgi:hypothetical protein